MRNHICVYDFETDGSDPSVCQPVQLAACILDFRGLEIMEGSEFCSYMRPDGIDDSGYLDDHMDTIIWHAKNYNPDWNELSDDGRDNAVDKIVSNWAAAPEQKQVFEDFKTYLLKYNTNQSNRNKWGAPIRGGINIERFDNVIMDRLCIKYKGIEKTGEQKIFHPRDQIDIMRVAFLWFESLPEPKKYNMDELRRFFGMSTKGAHDALNDVRDEARTIQKFIRLHRNLAHKIRFKGSMKNESKN